MRNVTKRSPWVKSLVSHGQDNSITPVQPLPGAIHISTIIDELARDLVRKAPAHRRAHVRHLLAPVLAPSSNLSAA